MAHVQVKEVEVSQLATDILKHTAGWAVDDQVRVAALRTAADALQNAIGAATMTAMIFNGLNNRR